MVYSLLSSRPVSALEGGSGRGNESISQSLGAAPVAGPPVDGPGQTDDTPRCLKREREGGREGGRESE